MNIKDRASLARILILFGVLLLCVTPAYAFLTSSQTPGASETSTSSSNQSEVFASTHNHKQKVGEVSIIRNKSVQRFVIEGDKNSDTFDIEHTSNTFGIEHGPNGQLYVAVAVAKQDQNQCKPYNPPCGRTGVYIYNYSNGNYTRTAQWTYPVRKAHGSEVHDFEIINETHLLVVGMYKERVFIVNRKTGEIPWQWNASSRYQPPPDPTKKDWLHMNDVDIIEPGRYLVSVRNANQLVIIERGKGVVDVVNKNQNPETLHEQHNPQWLGEGAILVADSENNRIVELHERNGTWTVAWQLRSAGGESLHWPRDADRLPNGNTLIADTRNHRILEVTPNGSVVWNNRVGKNYEADMGRKGEQTGDLPTASPTEEAKKDGSSNTVVHQALLLSYAGIDYLFNIPYWIDPFHFGVMGIGVVSIFIGGSGELLPGRIRNELSDHRYQIVTGILLLTSGITIGVAAQSIQADDPASVSGNQDVIRQNLDSESSHGPESELVIQKKSLRADIALNQGGKKPEIWYNGTSIVEVAGWESTVKTGSNKRTLWDHRYRVEEVSDDHIRYIRDWHGYKLRQNIRLIDGQTVSVSYRVKAQRSINNMLLTLRLFGNPKFPDFTTNNGTATYTVEPSYQAVRSNNSEHYQAEHYQVQVSHGYRHLSAAPNPNSKSGNPRFYRVRYGTPNLEKGQVITLARFNVTVSE